MAPLSASSIEGEDLTPGEKVLIVEDDADIRQFLVTFLREEGVVATAVESGEKAIHYIEFHTPPSLILLDLTLPRMTGAQFMDVINDHPARGQMRIFIASGWDNLAQRAKEIGADGFLKKPFDLDKISELIKTLS